MRIRYLTTIFLPLLVCYATALAAESVDDKAARFGACSLSPATLHPGEALTLRIQVPAEALGGVEFRHQYHVAPENVPQGFAYSRVQRVAYLADPGERLIHDNGSLDADPAKGTIEVRIDTTAWAVRLYHFKVSLQDAKGGVSDERDFGVKVAAPDERIEAHVSPSWRLCTGTHPQRVLRLRNGTLLHEQYVSTDNGATWTERSPGTVGAGAVQLRDGTVLGMNYRTFPVEGRAGWYRGERYVSTDDGGSVEGPIETLFHVPQAKAAEGHAYHPGPLFMRSIVERPDGSLVALMAGWFIGDDAPCPYNPKRPYSRTYCCESADRGATWTFLSNMGYDHIGSEGYNEGSMKALPDGTLMAVMRTGSMSDPKCQDNPIMLATSSDWGKTWTAPRRTGVMGAFPDLAVLSDGVLALSYGRPGSNIVFSLDQGKTWIGHTIVDPVMYSGYTTITETAPGEILMVYGAKNYFEPSTGTRRNDLRVARMAYRGVIDESGANGLH